MAAGGWWGKQVLWLGGAAREPEGERRDGEVGETKGQRQQQSHFLWPYFPDRTPAMSDWFLFPPPFAVWLLRLVYHAAGLSRHLFVEQENCATFLQKVWMIL